MLGLHWVPMAEKNTNCPSLRHPFLPMTSPFPFPSSFSCVLSTPFPHTCTQRWTVELKNPTLPQDMLDGESGIWVFRRESKHWEVNPLFLLLNIPTPSWKLEESWRNLHSFLPLSLTSWSILFYLALLTILHLLQLLLDPLACLSSHPPHWNGTNSIILFVLNLSVEKTQYSKLKAIVQPTLQLLRSVYVNVTQMEEAMSRMEDGGYLLCNLQQLLLQAALFWSYYSCFLWLGLFIYFLSSFLSMGIVPAPRCLPTNIHSSPSSNKLSKKD